MGKRLGNKGFTLIEASFTLLIISVLLLLITSVNSDGTMLRLQASKLENMFYASKAYALVEKQSQYIEINGAHVRASNKNMKLQNGMVCEVYQFNINGKGNVNMANTIECYLGNHQISVVMHIGNANFYVK